MSVTRDPIRSNYGRYRPPTMSDRAAAAPAPSPATTPAPAKPAPIADGLTLGIDGSAYAVEVMRRHPDDGAAMVVRLVKHKGGDVYDVAELPDGHADCTCGDFIYRRAGLDPSGCKHVKMLRKVGLIHDPIPPRPRVPADSWPAADADFVYRPTPTEFAAP